MKFVDLAGSERVASKRGANLKTCNDMSMWEGACTNFSLMEL